MPRLTDEEYEDMYRESLRCLADAGHAVGTPYLDEAGIRRCVAGEWVLDDRGVIGAWWSEKVTQEIFEGRDWQGRKKL